MSWIDKQVIHSTAGSHSHFGSSHFLFERAYGFLASRAFFCFCLVQVFRTQFCCLHPAFMANARPFDDAEHANVPNSLVQDLSSNFGSFDGSVADLERVGARATSTMEENSKKDLLSSIYISERLDRFPCSYKDLPDLKTVSCHSHNQWLPLQTRLQALNMSSAASQLALPHWKLVLLPPQVSPARQDPRLHQDSLD